MATVPEDLELQQALEASLASQEKTNEEDLELAMALSASSTEHVPTINLNLAQENQAKRLGELKDEEEATFAFLAREHVQKEKEEAEATQFLLAHEQHQNLQADIDLALFLTTHPESKIDDEYFELCKAIKKMLMHVSLEQQAQYLQALAPILNSPAVKGECPNGEAGPPVTAQMDAHKYTCTLIRASIPILRSIDDVLRPIDLNLNPDMPPQAVLAEILVDLQKNYAETDPELQTTLACIPYITTSIQNLSAAATPIDTAETHAHVQQLLSRTWTLAKILGPDYKDAIAHALSNNIADGGGCIPGMVARLYPIYANMIKHTLTLSIEPIPVLKMHI